MIAYVDVENAKSKKVITYKLNVIEFNEFGNIIFDISNLDEKDLDILAKAVDSSLRYTDIELFYIDDDNIPYFGPDYLFNICGSKLVGVYTKKKVRRK